MVESASECDEEDPNLTAARIQRRLRMKEETHHENKEYDEMLKMRGSQEVPNFISENKVSRDVAAATAAIATAAAAAAAAAAAVVVVVKVLSSNYISE